MSVGAIKTRTMDRR